MPGLRAWLRKTPQPDHIRIRTADDEDRKIELSADARNRWKAAEEAVLAMRAVAVECLDKDGAILRAQRLEVEVDEDEAADLTSYTQERKREEKLVARERRETGAILQAFGEQLNSAFDRGAAAANTGQENLVALVEVLTQHLSLAITNLHNVSVNLANIVAEQGQQPQELDNGALVNKVLGLAAMKAAQAATGGEAPPNGKKKTT